MEVKRCETCGQEITEIHSIGNRYREEEDGDFILAAATTKGACLINLSDGSRWRNSVVVESLRNISEAEWEQITGGFKFTRIL